MNDFLPIFVPLFVALDPIGLVPVFLGLTEGHGRPARRRIIWVSAGTAALVGVGFVLLGRWVFELLGVKMCDFQVAGGALLLLIAMLDVLTGFRPRAAQPLEMVGPVPLGTPLMAGPATLTTLLVLVQSYGLALSLTAFLATLALTVGVLLAANTLTRWLGQAGLRVLTKVAALVLAAYAVMLVREGVTAMVAQVPPH